MPQRVRIRIKVNCEICQKEFLARPYMLLKGKDRYCSRKCLFPNSKARTPFEVFISHMQDFIDEETCWIFIGATSKDGYCSFKCGREYFKSHRFSYEYYVGPIPEGLLIMHSCDTPNCCNPFHLSPGTNAQNSADRKNKNRGNRPIGTKNVKCVLTESDVIEIRKIHIGPYQRKFFHATAYMFGVNQDTIGNIVRRETWKHI
jgi:hypothetical protein